MKKRMLLTAITAVTLATLTGCSPTDDTPAVINYQSYPEQESADGARYDITSGAEDITQAFTSETIEPSEDIENVTASPDAIPRDLENSVVFDIETPVEAQPFAVKISYKSDALGYFVGVAHDGSYTEPIASFEQPGVQYSIIGTYPKAQTAGVKFVGDGKWDMEILPLSQLPVFNKEISGTGAGAFIVNGDTVKAVVETVGSGFVMRSYGYDNRVIFRNGGGGTQVADLAIPGNGAIIVISHTGEWKITKAKEVVVDE